MQKFGGLSGNAIRACRRCRICPRHAALPNTVDGLELTPPAKQKQIVDHWRTTFGVQ